MRSIFAVFVLILFGTFATAQTDADRQDIQELVATMATGWNESDGPKFASVFADQHDFIVWNGYYFKNMDVETNGKSHQNLFEQVYPNTHNHMVIDKVKFLRNDLALIHVFAAVTPAGDPKPEHPQVLWTGVVDKSQGGWKIVSFHNLDLEIFKDEQVKANAPMPAAVMYASWYRKNP